MAVAQKTTLEMDAGAQIESANIARLSVQEELDREKAAHESTRQELDSLRSSLENANAHRNALTTQMIQERRALNRAVFEKRFADEELQRLQAKLAHERTLCTQAQDALRDELAKHGDTVEELNKAEMALSTQASARADCQELEEQLRSVRTDLESAEAALAKRKQSDTVRSQQWEDSLRATRDELTRARAAHVEAEKASTRKLSEQREAASDQWRDLNRKKNELHRSMQEANDKLEQDMEAQRQAVDAYLKYCSASLSQGSWSHLHLASAGVGMNSRFNQPIRPSASWILPWILESLHRVVNAVTASGDAITPEIWSVLAPEAQQLTSLHAKCKESNIADDVGGLPAIVIVADQLDFQRLCIVLLQGIAYVHLVMKASSRDVTWTPKPREMLDSLSTIPSPGSMLALIFQRVHNLVNDGTKFESWISNDEIIDMRVDSSNSALPEGCILTYSHGNFYLVRSTASGEELFVIDRRAVKFKLPWLDTLEMHLLPTNGLPENIGSIELMSDGQHSTGLQAWLKA